MISRSFLNIRNDSASCFICSLPASISLSCLSFSILSLSSAFRISFVSSIVSCNSLLLITSLSESSFHVFSSFCISSLVVWYSLRSFLDDSMDCSISESIFVWLL